VIVTGYQRRGTGPRGQSRIRVLGAKDTSVNKPSLAPVQLRKPLQLVIDFAARMGGYISVTCPVSHAPPALEPGALRKTSATTQIQIPVDGFTVRW
jgi:hypothetical protein